MRFLGELLLESVDVARGRGNVGTGFPKSVGSVDKSAFMAFRAFHTLSFPWSVLETPIPKPDRASIPRASMEERMDWPNRKRGYGNHPEGSHLPAGITKRRRLGHSVAISVRRKPAHAPFICRQRVLGADDGDCAGIQPFGSSAASSLGSVLRAKVRSRVQISRWSSVVIVRPPGSSRITAQHPPKLRGFHVEQKGSHRRTDCNFGGITFELNSPQTWIRLRWYLDKFGPRFRPAGFLPGTRGPVEFAGLKEINRWLGLPGSRVLCGGLFLRPS